MEEVEAMDASPLKNEIQQTDKFSHSYPNKEEFLNPDMRRDGSRGVSWGVNTSIYALVSDLILRDRYVPLSHLFCTLPPWI